MGISAVFSPPANQISDSKSNLGGTEFSIVTDQPKDSFSVASKAPSSDILKYNAANQYKKCCAEKITEKSSCIAIAAGAGAGVGAIGCGGGGHCSDMLLLHPVP